MRWLITGGGGMLGQDLAHSAATRNHEVVVQSKDQLDVADAARVRDLVNLLKPDVIVNCAAYTRVDDAEANEDVAMRINAGGAGNLAKAADAIGALLIQISTDFVFSGTKRRPYEPDDPTAPLSAYGRSKLLGEENAATAKKHLIIRTSWLFGVHGPNFVEAIRNQIVKGNRSLKVVNDQHGRPTYIPHLVDAIFELGERAAIDPSARGMVHYADDEPCTWFDFASEIVALLASPAEGPVTIEPVTTDAFPRPAHRPPYSVLSIDRYVELAGRQPKKWKDGLREYIRLKP